MRIYLDLDTRKLMSSTVRPLSKLEFKRRDNDSIELVFLRTGEVQELAAGTLARLGIKADADYDSDFLSLTTLTQSGTGASTVYSGELNLNTTAIATAFAAEPVTLAAMLEVEWTSGSVVSSSLTLPVVLLNDVIRGDEGEPVEIPIFYTSATSDLKATQAQAEAGADNAAWMTPLRTAQAISATRATYGEAIAGENNSKIMTPLLVAEAISSAGAGLHTHPLAQITQSGAAVGQVATWNGTAWSPQTPSGGGGGGGGTPSAHAASHASAGTDPITPSSIGAIASSLDVTTISVVTSMPAEPDPLTLYLVLE
jgi:hypothetical protein